jgi:dienelactone hydrolase
MSFDRRKFLASTGIGIAAAATCSQAAQAQDERDGETHRPTPPPDGRQAIPTKADLGSLYPVVAQLAEKNRYPYSFVGDRFATLADFKAAGRAKVLEIFGTPPAAVEPQAEVVDRQQFADYVREKIVFSTTPHFRVPAYVHIPRGLKGRAPAIIDLHSHGGMFLFGKEKVIDFGQNHPVMTKYHATNYEGRPTTTALVRRGYVVITIDAFMFGERRLWLEEDRDYGWDRSQYSVEDADHLNRKCRAKESTLAKSLALAGCNWPGIVTWDDMRTVDYLLTRPEVDPARIGCLGVSFGGWRTLFLAGLDERIAAACIVGFMSTVKPMLQRHIDTHSWVHFVPELHRWLDLPDVASMMAPKPLLVQQCRQDGLFPLVGMEQSVEKIAAVYAKADAREQFSGRFYDVPHRFDMAMQDDAFAWLDRMLK